MESPNRTRLAAIQDDLRVLLDRYDDDYMDVLVAFSLLLSEKAWKVEDHGLERVASRIRNEIYCSLKQEDD